MVMVVGLESTVDACILFQDLAKFRKFINEYEGLLEDHLEEAYLNIIRGVGEEVPIDGYLDAAEELIEKAGDSGADVKYSLGGNGAQEAAALSALGSNVIFIGKTFPNYIAEILDDDQDFINEVDLSFAEKTDKHKPISVIFQAIGTNRYILCEGRGRRIKQLMLYLKKLPEIISKISRLYGEPEIVNLVGWQVLFAKGIKNKDFLTVKRIIEKIRKHVDSPLFTDAGGLGILSDKEKRILCKVYSLFDILSVNEDELIQISDVIQSKSKNEFQVMHDLINSFQEVSTIWLHSSDYQASLSSDYNEKILKKAQTNAAAAGVHKVEKRLYPTLEELQNRRKIENYSDRGLEKVKRVMENRDEMTGDKFSVITPCFKARDFKSTVGAGDTAASAYTYTLTYPDKEY